MDDHLVKYTTKAFTTLFFRLLILVALAMLARAQFRSHF